MATCINYYQMGNSNTSINFYFTISNNVIVYSTKVFFIFPSLDELILSSLSTYSVLSYLDIKFENKLLKFSIPLLSSPFHCLYSPFVGWVLCVYGGGKGEGVSTQLCIRTPHLHNVLIT